MLIWLSWLSPVFIDSEKFTCEPRLLLGLARIYDMLNDPESAITYYKKVLVLDASCVEAIACLGAHFFYSDQVRCDYYGHLRAHIMTVTLVVRANFASTPS